MFQRLASSFFSVFKMRYGERLSSLQEWRARVLDGILRGIAAVWLFALASGLFNVVESYRKNAQLYDQIYSDTLQTALTVAVIYMGVSVLMGITTFNRKLPYELRAGVLLFILYALGVTGFVLASFSGDGRVFFFAFVVISAILFDLRYSVIAFIFTLVTWLVIGWLEVNETIVIPAEAQINSTDLSAWVSGTLVFLAMSLAAYISITYLLRVLGASLEETRQSLERERRMGRTLRTVSEINQAIIRAQDCKKLLQEACELLVTGRGYDFVWVGLLEADKATLKLAAFAGEAVDESKYTFHLGREGESLGCAEKAIRAGTFIRIDPSDENDPCLACPRRVKYPDRSAVSLPLIREGEAMGILVIDHFRSAPSLDDQEIALLQELTDDLAYAIEKLLKDSRLRLLSRYKTMLSDVTAAALETNDTKAFLQAISDKMCEAYGASACYIVLWDEKGNNPTPAAATGHLAELFAQTEVTLGEAKLVSSLFDEGETLVSEETQNDPRIAQRLAELFSIRSVIGLPLMTKMRRYGGVFIAYDEPRRFTPEEVSYGEQAAGQTALALEKIRLHAETQAKAWELETLYAAANDMASSLLDPPALLEKLARHMTESLKVTSANIMSVNLANETMKVVGEFWSEYALPEEIHPDLGRVFENGPYSTIINSMLAGRVIEMHFDDEEMMPAERAQFSEFGIKTMLFVPIMARGQLLGDIELWESRHRRQFSDSEIRLAQAMAGHAASIIETAELFARTREQESELRALLTVSRAVSSSLHPSDVLRQAASTLARLMRVDFCALSDYFPERNEVATIALYSAHEDVSEQDDLGRTFSLDEYPATLNALQTGQPLVIRLDDPAADSSEIRELKANQMFSSLLIPLRLRGQSLGLAELFTSDPDRVFMAEEIQFASAIADQVTIAVENARLYERLEQREAYFRALIENSAEGVAIVDSNGKVIYIAPSETRLTGYSVEEITGGSAFKYIHPEDIVGVLDVFSEGAAEPGAVRTVEYRLRRKDGEWRHFEVTGHNMLDDPHIAGIVVNYRDITERKLADKALEESEARYRTIFQSAGVAIWEDDYSALMKRIDEIKRSGVDDFEAYLAERPGFIKEAADLIRILDVNMAAIELMEAENKAALLQPLGRFLSGGGINSFRPRSGRPCKRYAPLRA